MTGQVDEERVVDIVYLSMAFNFFSFDMLIKKLLDCNLDGQTLRWIEKELSS